MRISPILAAFCAALCVAAADVARAQQESPRENDGRRLIDTVRERLQDELRRFEGDEANERANERNADETVIDFEQVRGRSAGAAVPLTTQYQRTHGVTFGPGVSVHRCSSAYDEFANSQCPYPRAASGERAAMFDPETGGRALTIDFAEPVLAVSMRVNPSGGRDGETFTLQAIAFGADGEEVARAEQRLVYNQNAFTWPTRLSLKGEGGIARVMAAVSQPGNFDARALTTNAPNRQSRFFFDDLSFARAAEGPAPVAAGVSAQDGPPRSPGGVIVQSPSLGPAQARLEVYPAAVRKRLRIDWDAAFADFAEQQSLGLAAAAPAGDGQAYVDRAELPVLMPTNAEAGSLRVFGNRDTVNAVWRSGGRDYSVYGSRLVSVIDKAQGASGVRSAVTFSGTDDELTASFSLYGASYALTQYCNGGAEADPACYDRDALGAVLETLVVVIGEAGSARP